MSQQSPAVRSSSYSYLVPSVALPAFRVGGPQTHWELSDRLPSNAGQPVSIQDSSGAVAATLAGCAYWQGAHSSRLQLGAQAEPALPPRGIIGWRPLDGQSTSPFWSYPRSFSWTPSSPYLGSPSDSSL